MTNTTDWALQQPCPFRAYIGAICRWSFFFFSNGVSPPPPPQWDSQVIHKIFKRIILEEALTAWAERDRQHKLKRCLWTLKLVQGRSTLRKLHKYRKRKDDSEGKTKSLQSKSKSCGKLLPGNVNLHPTGFQNCYEPVTSMHPQFPTLLNRRVFSNYAMLVLLLQITCLSSSQISDLALRIQGTTPKEPHEHLDLIWIMKFWTSNWYSTALGALGEAKHILCVGRTWITGAQREDVGSQPLRLPPMIPILQYSCPCVTSSHNE